MRAGYNPTRRNRNIGTAKQGHGKSNRLVIPAVCSGERYWGEVLQPHVVVRRFIRSREITFIVEACRADCRHACSVEDVAHVFAHVPPDDLSGIDTLLFRQSTRKQALLRPAWGRIHFSADLGLPGGKTLRSGPIITLEATNCGERLAWPSALSPSDRDELERLRRDGHAIERDGRSYIISISCESARAIQLYRTLLHEIGHWVDFKQRVVVPADAGVADYATLSEAYFARASDEREYFAHAYAESMRAHLVKFGIIPFDPLVGAQT
jgi:hypothetical protein